MPTCRQHLMDSMECVKCNGQVFCVLRSLDSLQVQLLPTACSSGIQPAVPARLNRFALASLSSRCNVHNHIRPSIASLSWRDIDCPDPITNCPNTHCPLGPQPPRNPCKSVTLTDNISAPHTSRSQGTHWTIDRFDRQSSDHFSMYTTSRATALPAPTRSRAT